MHHSSAVAFVDYTSVAPPRMPSAHTFDTSTYSKAIQEYYRRNRAMSEAFTAPEAVKACTSWLDSHCFRVSADLCIDGRVSDFSEALGLPMGMLEMYRSGGCRDNVLDSLIYASRISRANEKYQVIRIGEKTKAMSELRLVTVHYSSSRPQEHSCAAWDHQTKTALEAMQMHAMALNTDFKGTMVAIVVLVDTDTDAITVLGPNGMLDVALFAESAVLQNGNLRKTIFQRLVNIFPADWAPLRDLKQGEHREAFHCELAEHLEANVMFYRRVKRSHRPVELITHQERLIYIGRPLETSDRNEAFLIEDGEREMITRNFKIGLQFVVTNCILDAIQTEDRNWTIPVVINIPHMPSTADEALMRRYALSIRHGKKTRHGDEPRKPGLEALCREHRSELEMSIKFHLAHTTDTDIPDWIEKGVKDIPERIVWSVNVADRRSRLSIPCE